MTITGANSLLVVDPETRAVVNIGPTSDRQLTERSRSVLPGEGPIINVSGFELPDERWVVTGNDCDDVEVLDPRDCSNGSTTVAVLDGRADRALENVPKELHREPVSVVGASSDEVVFETWREGDSSYWTLDLGTSTFHPISWAPVPLVYSDAVPTDGEPSAYHPDRRSCVAGDRLLVVDGAPAGPELVTTISVLNIRTGALQVDAQELDLGSGVILDGLLCAEGETWLLALDHDTNEHLAYGLSVGSGRVESGTPNAASALGLLSATSYGQRSLAVTYSVSGPSVEVEEPASPDVPGTVTSTGEVGVVAFDGDRWETIVEPGDGSVKADERVYPLADPDSDGVIVQSDRSAEFRIQH